MFVIEDEWHAEWIATFALRDDAIMELRRLAVLPWNAMPNLAPCTEWATCGRRYDIVEYDSSATPWREVSREALLDVGASGVSWS